MKILTLIFDGNETRNLNNSKACKTITKNANDITIKNKKKTDIHIDHLRRVITLHSPFFNRKYKKICQFLPRGIFIRLILFIVCGLFIFLFNLKCCSSICWA